MASVPLLTTDGFWLNVLVLIGIYFIVGCGFTLLFGFADLISFGHAAFFGIGAYVSSLLALDYGVSPWLGLPAATVVSGAVGFALGRPILRLRGLSLAMATLAFGQIMYILFLQLPVTGGAVGLAGIPPLSLGGLELFTPDRYLYVVWAIAGVVLLLSYNISRGHFGRALKAIGSNEHAATAVGVDVAAYKARVFAYSTGLAGLGGALYAHYVTFISADSFALNLSILLFLVVAVGGRASLMGAVLGAAFVVLAPELFRSSGGYSTLLYGAVLTVTFMYAPDGLVGILTRLRARAAGLRPRPYARADVAPAPDHGESGR